MMPQSNSMLCSCNYILYKILITTDISFIASKITQYPINIILYYQLSQYLCKNCKVLLAPRCLQYGQKWKNSAKIEVVAHCTIYQKGPKSTFLKYFSSLLSRPATRFKKISKMLIPLRQLVVAYISTQAMNLKRTYLYLQI